MPLRSIRAESIPPPMEAPTAPNPVAIKTTIGGERSLAASSGDTRPNAFATMRSPRYDDPHATMRSPRSQDDGGRPVAASRPTLKKADSDWSLPISQQADSGLSAEQIAIATALSAALRNAAVTRDEAPVAAPRAPPRSGTAVVTTPQQGGGMNGSGSISPRPPPPGAQPVKSPRGGKRELMPPPRELPRDVVSPPPRDVVVPPPRQQPVASTRPPPRPQQQPQQQHAVPPQQQQGEDDGRDRAETVDKLSAILRATYK